MEEYLLDADSLLLEPDSLFYSTSKEAFGVCFYPFVKRNVRSQIQDLGEFLLNHINHEEEKVVKMTYQFYRLTREGNFEISQVVDELIRENGSWDCENMPKEEEKRGQIDTEKVANMTEKGGYMPPFIMYFFMI